MEKIYLIDGSNYTSDEFFEKKFKNLPTDVFKLEKRLLRENKLIKYYDYDRFKIIFVGEFITPNCHYISLPKTFILNDENIKNTKKILDLFRNLEDADKKRLISSYSYSPDNKDTIESEIFYFKKLKKYFYDYVILNFIYPKDKISKTEDKIEKLEQKYKKIDYIDTKMSMKQGLGSTYILPDKNKQSKVNKDWKLDEIYITILEQLSLKYNEEDKFKNFKETLINDGFFKKWSEVEIYGVKYYEKIINDTLNKEDIDVLIKHINSCNVDIQHLPVKKTLIDYLLNKKIDKLYTIDAFASNNFAKVWEIICQKILKHDKDGLNVLKQNFRKINFDRTKIKITEDSEPDIYSNDSVKFLGDSKYYPAMEGSFDKEFFRYNILKPDNIKMPISLFFVGQTTDLIDVADLSDKLKLCFFQLDLIECCIDYKHNTYNVLEKVQELLNKTFN